MYKEMMFKGIVPDSDTYVHLFKACARLGDVKTAFNALKVRFMESIYVYFANVFNLNMSNF